MGPAVYTALATFFTSATIEVVIIRTILINVVLMSLRFKEGGEEFVALGGRHD